MYQIGLALKMEEYMPDTKPINSASEKFFVVSPPRKYKAPVANNTVNTV